MGIGMGKGGNVEMPIPQRWTLARSSCGKPGQHADIGLIGIPTTLCLTLIGCTPPALFTLACLHVPVIILCLYEVTVLPLASLSFHRIYLSVAASLSHMPRSTCTVPRCPRIPCSRLAPPGEDKQNSYGYQTLYKPAYTQHVSWNQFPRPQYRHRRSYAVA